MPPKPPTPARGQCSPLANEVDLLYHGSHALNAAKTDTAEQCMALPLGSRLWGIRRIALRPQKAV